MSPRLFAILVLLSVAACDHRSAASRGASQLVVARLSEPSSLNPLYLQGPDVSDVSALLFSSLTRYDERNQIAPDVAAVVPTVANGGISADGRHIVYRLRHGVRWQDGIPLTARDVVFTYRASVDRVNAIPAQSDYDSIESVSAPNPYEVDVLLKRPFAPIVATFFGGDGRPILPSHVLEKYKTLVAARFNLSPIGSGPYRLERWLRGDRLDLVANDHYYAGTPKIARISIRFVSNHATILNELRTGDVDATFLASPAEIRSLRALPEHTVVVTRDRPSFGVIVLNLGDVMFHDVAVRRAFAAAIDRSAIAKKATYGMYDAATGTRGLFGWAYDPKADAQTYDSERARELLEKAGWHTAPDGVRTKNGRRLQLQFVFYGRSFAAGTIVPLIVEEARVAGFDVKAKPYDINQLYAPGGPLERGTFQIALLGMQTGLDPDPSSYVACGQVPPNGFNFARYCDPDVDLALHRALATYERSERKPYYSLIQRKLAADVPYVFLWQPSEIDVIPNALRGYEPSAKSGPYASVARWHF
ncbi:MAG TPA: ABC transporter substrate-binding protein [Candidatus Tumulicola sp.]|jgi:peptide/nickel transport system substrate-binding protein